MKRILFNATPFGFGPISKAFSLLKIFVKNGYECTFIGSGIAYEYAKRENICESIYLDLYHDENAKDALYEISEKFDYGISVMEPIFPKWCSKKLNIAYLDSLFWMWDKQYFNTYPELRNVEYYFSQNTFDMKEKCNRSVIKNFVETRCIIDKELIDSVLEEKKKCQKERKLIIHMGGVENVVVDFEKIIYPFSMFNVINRALNNSYFDRILVVSSERTCKKLKSMYPNEKYEFKAMEHEEFLEEMKSAEIIVTTPGLTMLLEAFSMKEKIIILLPQNYSQYLIINKLERFGYPMELMNYDKLFLDFYIDEDTPEEEAVNYIVEKQKELFKNENLLKLLQSDLEKKITSMCMDRELVDQVLQYEEKFIEDIGDDGVEQIYHTIQNKYFVNIEDKYIDKNKVGNKAKGIVELKQLNLNVPPTFICTEKFYNLAIAREKIEESLRTDFKHKLMELLESDIDYNEEFPCFIIRFGEKVKDRSLPRSIPFFGIDKEKRLSKEVYKEREELIRFILGEKYSDAQKRMVYNEYTSIDEMMDMVFEFLIQCTKKLENIQQGVESIINKNIIIQRQPNTVLAGGKDRTANGMLYSIDPYGENIEDYGRYTILGSNSGARDLSEMKTDFTECYYKLKGLKGIINKYYNNDPRFIEYVVTDSGKVWLIQNRARWHTKKIKSEDLSKSVWE